MLEVDPWKFFQLQWRKNYFFAKKFKAKEFSSDQFMNYLVTGHVNHVLFNSVLVQKEYFFPMEQAQDIIYSEDRNRQIDVFFLWNAVKLFSERNFFSEIMKFCVVR